MPAYDTSANDAFADLQFGRARNERRKARREGNGQEAAVGHYERSERAYRTQLYFRHKTVQFLRVGARAAGHLAE